MVHLAAREITIIRMLCVEDGNQTKQIAFALHLTEGSLKSYLVTIYRKLGWFSGGSQRRLALYGIAHRVALGIDLPEIQDEAINPS